MDWTRKDRGSAPSDRVRAADGLFRPPQRRPSVSEWLLGAWLSTAALLTLAGPLAAQDDPEEALLEPPAARQGYFLGGGFGLAVNSNFRDEAEDTGALTGSAGQGRIGQMVTPWLGFGLQFGGGSAANDAGFDTGFGGLLLDTQIVPFGHLAVHLGIGAGGLSLTDPAADPGTLDGTGGGYFALGLSYDWFPFYEGGSGGLSFTPNVQLQLLPGQIFRSTIVTVSLDILWWTGLDTNKLDLPPDQGFDPAD